MSSHHQECSCNLSQSQEMHLLHQQSPWAGQNCWPLSVIALDPLHRFSGRNPSFGGKMFINIHLESSCCGLEPSLFILLPYTGLDSASWLLETVSHWSGSTWMAVAPRMLSKIYLPQAKVMTWSTMKLPTAGGLAQHPTFHSYVREGWIFFRTTTFLL